jgi:hypothetical protein
MYAHHLMRDHMTNKSQLLIYLILLLVFDTLLPLPITAGILLYVVLKQPMWFRELYHLVYK